jgi:zinc/manganese transport system substrate-binding protein
MVRGPAVLAVLVVLTAACTGGGGRARMRDGHPVLRVVAAENVWGNIAAQVGGDRVEVTSLIRDPNSDPHEYEVTPRDAAAVSRADIVVKNGKGYDRFVDALLGTGSRKNRTVVTAADFARGDNPHVWYDIAAVASVADAIGAALTAHDAADEQLFAENRDRFTESLRPTLNVRDTIGKRFPRAAVAYTERVPEYLLDQAGLEIVSPPGFARAVEDGVEPSAHDQQAMRDLITQHRVRVLLYNPQATSRVTDAVRSDAAAAGIPIVAMTETMPPAQPSYQAWMHQQLQELLAALER